LDLVKEHNTCISVITATIIFLENPQLHIFSFYSLNFRQKEKIKKDKTSWQWFDFRKWNVENDFGYNFLPSLPPKKNLSPIFPEICIFEKESFKHLPFFVKFSII